MGDRNCYTCDAACQDHESMACAPCHAAALSVRDKNARQLASAKADTVKDVVGFVRRWGAHMKSTNGSQMLNPPYAAGLRDAAENIALIIERDGADWQPLARDWKTANLAIGDDDE